MVFVYYVYMRWVYRDVGVLQYINSLVRFKIWLGTHLA